MITRQTSMWFYCNFSLVLILRLILDIDFVIGFPFGNTSHGVPEEHINISQVPFMAVYHPDFSLLHYCGAVIVHPWFLLSAAHCCFAFRHVHPHVTVGTDSLLKRGDSYEIKEFFLHPQWNKTRLDYDIMVIRLKTALRFDQRVQPVKMAQADLIIEKGVVLEAVGFGSSRKTGIVSLVLRRVQLPYVSWEECSMVYSQADSPVKITDNMLCAGGELGENTCKGDSGGPLLYQNLLVGTISFGAPHKLCAQKSEPSVFTQISALRPFIDHVIKHGMKVASRSV